jgi:hypothetical protein
VVLLLGIRTNLGREGEQSFVLCSASAMETQRYWESTCCTSPSLRHLRLRLDGVHKKQDSNTQRAPLGRCQCKSVQCWAPHTAVRSATTAGRQSAASHQNAERPPCVATASASRHSSNGGKRTRPTHRAHPPPRPYFAACIRTVHVL